MLTGRIESLFRANLDNDLTVFEITRFNCRLLHSIKRKAKNTTLSVPFQNSRNIGKTIPLTHIDMTAHIGQIIPLTHIDMTAHIGQIIPLTHIYMTPNTLIHDP